MPAFVQNFVPFVEKSFSITVKNVVLFPQAQIAFFASSSIGDAFSDNGPSYIIPFPFFLQIPDKARQFRL